MRVFKPPRDDTLSGAGAGQGDRAGRSRWLALLLIATALIVPPVLGAAAAGRALAPLLVFPPPARDVSVAPFSWPVFTGSAAIVAVFAASALWLIMRRRPPRETGNQARRAMPWWGWLGLLLIAVFWVLAWSRFAWFEAFQGYTFSPLWLGYVLAINALSLRRGGHCLLTDHPRFLVLLVPASAVFWWYFEFLNRFVHNWRYAGLDNPTAFEYVASASLSFATVLPAVISTAYWLSTFGPLGGALRSQPSWPVTHGKAVAALAGVLGVAGLCAVGAAPEHTFGLVWIAPLAIISSARGLLGLPGVFSPLPRGDARSIGLAALAGLICGFFWELWNFHSLAHWEYIIPYVDGFRIFEMPLLGYAGYLPFGTECLAIAALASGAAAALNPRFGRIALQ